MKRRLLSTGFAMSLGILGALSAANAQPVKVGIIAPLTGGGAPWGIAADQAAKIAAAEVNAAGGLDFGGKKHPIEIVSYDDQYKAADAVAAYNRLVNKDDVKFILLHTSVSAVALKQNVEDDKILAVTGAYAADAINANTRYMFRLYSTTSDYMPGLAEWLKNNIKERRIVTLNPNDETGWDITNLSGKYLKQNGFEVLSQELYDRTMKDFSPLFTKVLAEMPDVIDLGGTAPATAGLMIRQVRELGYKGRIIKTSGPSPREIAAAAGNEAAEGTLMILYADPANPAYQREAAAFKQAVGQEPNDMFVPMYDGFKVLYAAIQKAGTLDDTAKVAQSFASVLPMRSMQGDQIELGGKALIGADQQVMTVVYVGVMKNGQPEIIGKVR